MATFGQNASIILSSAAAHSKYGYIAADIAERTKKKKRKKILYYIMRKAQIHR